MPIPKDFVDAWIGLTVGSDYVVDGELKVVNLSDPPCIFDSDGRELWCPKSTTTVGIKFCVRFTATSSVLYLGTKNRTKDAKFVNYTLKLLEDTGNRVPVDKSTTDEGMIINPFTGRKSWL